jgi:Leucine-rich repeat (LRR) protein
LERLDLSYSEVASIAPLAGILSLRELNLEGTQVSDLEPLRSCPGLQRLHLGNRTFYVHLSPDGTWLTESRPPSPIQSIDALPGCVSLRELALHNTLVADISALESCNSLETLDFSGAPLSSLVALRGAPKLRQLALHSTQVDNIEVLEDCPSLEVLDLVRSPVGDISPLREAKRLRHLALVQTAVSDIAALGDALHTLEDLNLQGSPVADISPLRHCYALKSLNLRGTDVTDVGCLAECPNLSRLVVDPGRIPEHQLSELVAGAGGRLQIPYFDFDQFPLVLEADIEGTLANEQSRP